MRATYWRLTLALAATAVGFVIWRAWVADDAFITFRHVVNFKAGYGPVFNPGERVQGFSHPLWFGMLLAGSYVLDVYAWAVSLGLISTAVIVLAAAVTLRGRPNDRLCLTALVIALLCSHTFVEFQTSGLEGCLSHALAGSLFGMVAGAAMRGQPPSRWSLLLCGLLVLTRPDHVIITGPVALALLIDQRRSWRRLILPIGLAVVLLAAWYGFALVYYGTPLPNTAYAKVSFPLPVALHKGWIYTWDFLKHEPLHGLAILAAIGLTVFTARRLRQSGRPGALLLLGLAAGLACQVAFVFMVGGDFMRGRFFATALVVSIFLLAHLLTELVPAQLPVRVLNYAITLTILVWAYLRLRPGDLPELVLGGYRLAQQHAYNHRVLAGLVVGLYIAYLAAGRAWLRDSRLAARLLFLSLGAVNVLVILAVNGYNTPLVGTIVLFVLTVTISTLLLARLVGGAVLAPAAMATLWLIVAANVSLCDFYLRTGTIHEGTGIADEYAWYAGRHRHNPFKEPFADRDSNIRLWEQMAEAVKAYADRHGQVTLAYGALGIVGYHGGPRVIIVDWFGLTDAYIARSPAPTASRAGHVEHEIPAGYLRERGVLNLQNDWMKRIQRLDPTLLADVTAAQASPTWSDPAERERWRKTQLVISGPLWSKERWRAIPEFALPVRRTLPPWPIGERPFEHLLPSVEDVAVP